MKHTYIYDKNYATYHDKYFEYIETIKYNFPKKLYDFATDHNRHLLNTKGTLHDAWLEEFSLTTDVIKSHNNRIFNLIFLHQSHDYKINIKYFGVKDIKMSLIPSLVEGFITEITDYNVDLLTHEFTMINDFTFQHLISFDRGVWIMVQFSDIEIKEFFI